MKVKSKFFVKIVSVIIITFMLIVPLSSTALADNHIDDIIKSESLADLLNLKKGETADVIVEFSYPSLLELNAHPDEPGALIYEQKLLSIQDAILDQLGIVPMFRYTGVINAAAIKATADEIRTLEGMSGVRGVHLSESFTALTTDNDHEIAISHPDMMGISTDITSEYTGDGVLVAVLDGGITFEHEAFNNTKHVKNPALTSSDLIRLGYSGGYYNQKIPFYHDYSDAAVKDCLDVNGHGSHVAGIIAGYAENEDGTVKFSGIAPGAQLCVMRVLNEYGAGNDHMVIAALEDAYKLGVDIINLSFGQHAAFRFGNQDPLLAKIFEKLEEAGVMVVCAAGNSASMAENTTRHVLDENCVDYGTLNLPAVFPGNISVGSVDSGYQYTTVINIGGEGFLFTDAHEGNDVLGFKKVLNGKSVDIAYFDNYGKKEDYNGVDVAGKIVAVKRGELSFTDKHNYAVEAGAIGLIIINGENDSWGKLSITNQMIPAILVDHSVAEILPLNDCVITIENHLDILPSKGELSYFSAVGVTPDLEIGLDILGVGGSIVSVKGTTANEYTTHSGTSMAAPSVAGTYALFYQMLKERDVAGEKDRSDITNYIQVATQSTAKLLSDELGNLYSPRFQGSGLVDLNKAVATNTYITTPLVCLKDDKSASGRVVAEYELVNIGDEDVNYISKVSAIIDSFMQVSPTDYKNKVAPDMLDSYLYNYVIYANGVAIANDEAFTLPANGTVKIKLELELLPMAVSILSEAFPYGYFLDGFIEFYDVNDPTKSAIHGGYVSFVGDWLEGPAIDPLTQADVMDWLYSTGKDSDMLPYFTAGHINANYAYSSIFLCDEETFFLNSYFDLPYIGQNPLANGEYVFSHDDRNAISSPLSNADEVIFDCFIVSPSLLRSCKSVRYVVTNSETGEVYASKTQEYITKDVPLGSYEYFKLSYMVFEPTYTAPNEFGEIVEKYIPSGTEITISIYTLLDYHGATERLEAEYTVTVDYTAPKFYYEYDADTKMLTVKCSDSEYIAGIVLEKPGYENTPDTRLESRIYADKTPGLSYTESFDLSDYDGDSIIITVSDYASNMIKTELSLTSGDISNMEGSAIVGSEITVDFADPLYIYQEIDFTVVPAEGYCFTDDFAILVNGEKIAPILVENGAYSYRITLTEEELEITSVGTMAHSFVPTVTTAATCVDDGELSHICSNCSYVGGVEVIPSIGHLRGAPSILVEPTCTETGISSISCKICGIILETPSIEASGHVEGEAQIIKEATCSSAGLSSVCCKICGATLSNSIIDQVGHTPGEVVITKYATCVEPGLSVVKCEGCDCIIDAAIIPAIGHDHTTGDKATAFSPAVCGVCGESYGDADSNGILVLSLVLSVVATTATVIMAIAVFVKKKR